MDWSSPHWIQTLLSASHGLFAWTPITLVGFAGLLLGLGRDARRFGALLVGFALLTWVNGGVRDWAAGDAFGARRYDLAMPLVAVGLAHLIARMTVFLARRPLAAPALVVVGLAGWNVGFVAARRAGHFPDAAPLADLARVQARQLRVATQLAAGTVFCPTGAALVYDFLSGEYFYEGRFNPGGEVVLARANEEDLSGRWSPPRRPREGPSLRWVDHPEACIRIPLREPFDFDATLTARAPRRAAPNRRSSRS